MPQGEEATAVADPIPDDLPAAVDAPANEPTLNLGDQSIDDDAAVDAAVQAAIAGKGQAAAEQAYASKAPTKPSADASKQGKPPEPEAAKTATGTTPKDDQGQPAALDEPTKQLLRRYQLRESVLLKLEPEERAEFVANLKERHDAQAQLWTANQQLNEALKAQQTQRQAADPQTQRQPAQPAAPKPGDPFAKLDEIFGHFTTEGETVAPLKDALLASVKEILGPVAQRAQAAEAQVQQFWADQAERDKDLGIEAVKSAEVDFDQRKTDGKANKEKLMQKAQLLLNGAMTQQGWTPKTYGWKEAISDAFPLVFKAQLQLAQRRESAKAAVTAARQSSDANISPSRTKPKDGDDAVIDRVLDAMKRGGTREEMMAIANAG